MALFGKGRARMEVVSAELLPHGKQLYIIVADAECNLHVLQYDPERKSILFSPTSKSASRIFKLTASTINRSKIPARPTPPPKINLPHRPRRSLTNPPPLNPNAPKNNRSTLPRIRRFLLRLHSTTTAIANPPHHDIRNPRPPNSPKRTTIPSSHSTSNISYESIG